MRGLRPDTRGFSLIEAVFAVLLLSVGLMAVAGMMSQAARTLHKARDIQAAAAAVEALADSLALFGASGSGTRTRPWGTVVWMHAASGGLADVHLVAYPADTTEPPLVDVVATVPANE